MNTLTAGDHLNQRGLPAYLRGVVEKVQLHSITQCSNYCYATLQVKHPSQHNCLSDLKPLSPPPSGSILYTRQSLHPAINQACKQSIKKSRSLHCRFGFAAIRRLQLISYRGSMLCMENAMPCIVLPPRAQQPPITHSHPKFRLLHVPITHSLSSRLSVPRLYPVPVSGAARK